MQQPTLSGTRIKQSSRSSSSFMLSQSNSPASASSSRRTAPGGGAKAQLRLTPSFFPWPSAFPLPFADFFVVGAGENGGGVAEDELSTEDIEQVNPDTE